MERSNSRFELKYRLDYFTYLKIKNAVQAHMKKDLYTMAAPGKGYLVRSLYYDTNEYQAYHEKMSGDNERVKFRIRTYHQTLSKNTPIRVELKERRSNMVIKQSSFVEPLAYQHFIKYHHWPNHESATLVEFEKYLHQKSLLPMIITEYYREGYETRIKNDLRITFDHDVRSAHATDLFPENVFFRQHHHHHLVLEIKFCSEPQTWVKNLVHAYGLKIIANSKFTQGIQLSRPDLHHPDGVVVVR